MSVQVTFTGNAGRDPETRNFNNGGSVTSIPVAVSQGYFDKSNNWVDWGTMWIDVEATAEYTRPPLYAAGLLRLGYCIKIRVEPSRRPHNRCPGSSHGHGRKTPGQARRTVIVSSGTPTFNNKEKG